MLSSSFTMYDAVYILLSVIMIALCVLFYHYGYGSGYSDGSRAERKRHREIRRANGPDLYFGPETRNAIKQELGSRYECPTVTIVRRRAGIGLY